MTYKRLLDEGKIRRHRTSVKEIKDLFTLVERDLKDASIKKLSTDRRFATAYNAILQAATIIMHCEGYRARGTGHHATTFEFIRIALGKEFEELVDYFDSCRVKRNIADYDRAGQVSEKETKDLLKEARKFTPKVKNWVKEKHPRLVPD